MVLTDRELSGVDLWPSNVGKPLTTSTVYTTVVWPNTARGGGRGGGGGGIVHYIQGASAL